MGKFVGVDFYDVDALLSEEQRMARDVVRAWVEERVLPIIERHNQDCTFPMPLVLEMAGLGIFGANLKGYGCAGMDNVAYGLIMQELERGDSGLRSFASVQSGLVMYPIYTFGSEAQKERWLPLLASGKAIGCFGLTEPDFGSNPDGMRTSAVADGGDYILNGAKMWITNGTIADVALVWARTEEGIRGFLVEKGTPGYRAPEMTGKWSLRASVTSEVILQDVRVPAAHMLPHVLGPKGYLSCLTQARYGIAWGAVGAALACYHTAVEYAQTRIQFGKPIGSFQLIQKKLADMLTQITSLQLLCWRLGQLKDSGMSGKHFPVEVSLAKRTCVATALAIAREARDILAANGILNEYCVFRHMVNLESVNTYEGTYNIHTLILGKEITGFSAFE